MDRPPPNRKQHGIHYTPIELAQFLATQLWRRVSRDANVTSTNKRLRILDPACGDGRLLESLFHVIPNDIEVEAHGFEVEANVAATTARTLTESWGHQLHIHHGDFLDHGTEDHGLPKFDLVITNPPYVRTQVLGQARSRRLAERFGLSGKIDLYQAFTCGISQLIQPGGMLALLTSNRFMYVQSGATMRETLQREFDLQSIVDFGDTRLFSASVLPVVVIARRSGPRNFAADSPRHCPFVRVYHSEEIAGADNHHNLFSAIDNPNLQSVRHNARVFGIERGRWTSDQSPRQPWSLQTSASAQWLATLKKNSTCCFADIADIRVGIKTTADSIFIRDDWERFETASKPEASLLRPLLTHHVAARWRASTPHRKVLYPYKFVQPRQVVELDDYPGAKHYLQSHRDQLRSRKYVIDAGRSWYEIWVPQQPMLWAQPKIVWPDISQQPTFFFDESGAIVNGDCYWIQLKEGVDRDWLYLMLAVANSKLAAQFYDRQFHNKLYAGRRRFMTQYVKAFPLPNLHSPVAIEMVALAKQLVGDHGASIEDEEEQRLESLVQTAFGFAPATVG